MQAMKGSNYICRFFVASILSLGYFHAFGEESIENNASEKESKLTKPLTINVVDSNKDIKIRKTGNTLVLGSAEIDGWIYPVPECEQCDLRVGKRFYPDGPSTTIELLNKQVPGQKWNLLDTYQNNLKHKEWTFNHQSPGVRVTKGGQTQLLNQGQQVQLEQCIVTNLWSQGLNQSTPPSNPNLPTTTYSDDQSKQRMQVLIECGMPKKEEEKSEEDSCINWSFPFFHCIF